MRNNNPRRDGIAAGGTAGKVDRTEFTSPPLPDQAHPDADDLRVERIAAQLEEAEQQRLTDDWIKNSSTPTPTLGTCRRAPFSWTRSM